MPTGQKILLPSTFISCGSSGTSRQGSGLALNQHTVHPSLPHDSHPQQKHGNKGVGRWHPTSQHCQTTGREGSGGTQGEFPAFTQLLPGHSRYLQLQAPLPLRLALDYEVLPLCSGTPRPFWRTPWTDGACQWPRLSSPGRRNNGTLKIQNPIHGRAKGHTSRLRHPS